MSLTSSATVPPLLPSPSSATAISSGDYQQQQLLSQSSNHLILPTTTSSSSFGIQQQQSSFISQLLVEASPSSVAQPHHVHPMLTINPSSDSNNSNIIVSPATGSGSIVSPGSELGSTQTAAYYCGGGSGCATSVNNNSNTTPAAGSASAWTLDPFGDDSSPAASNVFVCMLPSWISDSELRKMFQEFGQIESAKVMLNIHTGQSRGIAFVKFFHARDAQRAISALDGYSLSEGHRITVRLANAKAAYQPPGTPTNKTFVRNVPATVSLARIRDLFSQYGEVTDVSILPDAASSFNGINGGSTVFPPPPMLSPQTPPVATAGVPLIATESSSLPSSAASAKRIAFVTFATVESAAKAAEAVHTTLPFEECCGVPLLAKVAEDASHRTERLIRRQSNASSQSSSSSSPLQSFPHGFGSGTTMTGGGSFLCASNGVPIFGSIINPGTPTTPQMVMHASTPHPTLPSTALTPASSSSSGVPPLMTLFSPSPQAIPSSSVALNHQMIVSSNPIASPPFGGAGVKSSHATTTSFFPQQNSSTPPTTTTTGGGYNHDSTPTTQFWLAAPSPSTSQLPTAHQHQHHHPGTLFFSPVVDLNASSNLQHHHQQQQQHHQQQYVGVHHHPSSTSVMAQQPHHHSLVHTFAPPPSSSSSAALPALMSPSDSAGGQNHHIFFSAAPMNMMQGSTFLQPTTSHAAAAVSLEPSWNAMSIMQAQPGSVHQHQQHQHPQHHQFATSFPTAYYPQALAPQQTQMFPTQW